MTLLLSFILFRFILVYFFIKKISKLCFSYDRRFVKKNNEYFAAIIKDKYYFKKYSWSAYNFLFLRGPSFIQMVFSIKPLTLESQYDKESVNKLRGL
jgi:hypothetical protein